MSRAQTGPPRCHLFPHSAESWPRAGSACISTEDAHRPGGAVAEQLEEVEKPGDSDILVTQPRGNATHMPREAGGLDHTASRGTAKGMSCVTSRELVTLVAEGGMRRV